MQNEYKVCRGILFGIMLLLTGCTTTNTDNEIDMTNLKAASATNIKLGLAYLAKNNLAMAKEKLVRALNDDPKNPAAWYTIGYLLEITGHKLEAEHYFVNAIKVDPNDGNAKNNYGTFLCHQKRYQEGIKQFSLAIKSKNYQNTTNAYKNIKLCT